MTKRIIAFSLTLLMIATLSACSWSEEPEALSGTAPATVDVQPTPITTADEFLYDSQLSLADSFNQMNSLRLAVRDDMYSAVVSFADDSAWVPVAANKYALGCDEFLPASYVMEIEPGITAKKLFRENGFENIEISTLDIENTWKITATKKNDKGTADRYEFTVMYGAQSDSYRFTLSTNSEPTMLLASRRIAGGYAVQVWQPEGEHRILVQDVKEGRFGFIPKSRDAEIDFPDNDIYFDDSLVTSTFTTDGADYTFLVANSILYITRDGKNYAIPLK